MTRTRYYLAHRSWDGSFVLIPHSKIDDYNDWHDADIAADDRLDLPEWAKPVDIDNLTFTDPQPIGGDL